MARILLSEVNLPEGLVLGEPLTEPRDWQANPKAVAAQPFAAPKVHAPYYDSGRWKDIAPLFAVQYAASAPEVELELGEGLHFPWAVMPGLATAGCLVWVTDAVTGPYVRHIRLYPSHDEAAQGNAQLHKALADYL